MVYVALAASLAAGGAIQGGLFMMLFGLSFSTTRTEAYEQAGGAFVPAIRSAERSEEARRARRTRAKGGAGTGRPVSAGPSGRRAK
ncbi:hypothetical protein [Riemerella anatipestifer]|uniref:hypothetical protein n=1 Tax=Riemerella anatipestifer TaxID=34085 RepID=UPI003D9CA06E